jgi:ABC-type antimicrobial peptide transport system permease subunit
MMVGLSPDVRFVQVDVMADRADALLEPWRLGATMFVAFGGLALGIAAVGLYSLLAFAVDARRREIGIRTALGAPRAHVVGIVVRQSGTLLSVGVVVGTAAALVERRFLEPFLFGGQVVDVEVYVSVIAVLLVAAGLATSIPAWRATRVSPTVVLTEE